MPVPRLYVPAPLARDAELTLPERAARHVQVLRLQPGDALILFDGRGGECDAALVSMGRREARARVGLWRDVNREPAFEITLAVGMPANERMDWLVEKATELGAATVQPLECERAVLRLAGERAGRRGTRWQAIAIGAAEQSGRTVVPRIEPVRRFDAWLEALAAAAHDESRLLLRLGDAPRLNAAPGGRTPASVLVLSGPEGGLTPTEQEAATAQGFEPRSLGPRTLRAETAPLAALAQLTSRAA